VEEENENGSFLKEGIATLQREVDNGWHYIPFGNQKKRIVFDKIDKKESYTVPFLAYKYVP
jgi:hypothetical protein